MKYIPFLFLLFFSCNKNTKNDAHKNDFEMYEMTEMALLMEKMYHENEVLKSKIINKDDIGSFSNEYLKISSATMTETSDNDSIYKIYANIYIENQQKIYLEKGLEKENFNKMVDACIICHEVKCKGPIERIKKLYIK